MDKLILKTIYINLMLTIIFILIGTYSSNNSDIVITNQNNYIIKNVSLSEEAPEKILVPEGRLYQSQNIENSVEEITMEFSISTNNTVFDNTLENINIYYNNVTIGDNDEYSYLVNIDISLTDSPEPGVKVIVVNVTLTEPENKMIYNSIAGSNISFDIVFNYNTKGYISKIFTYWISILAILNIIYFYRKKRINSISYKNILNNKFI